MHYFILLFFMLSCLCEAADSYWTNSSGGDFTNAANWSNGVPTEVDNANFTNNATYQVDWTATVTNANAYLNPNSGTITQAIASSTWLVTNSYIIGQNATDTGTVTHTTGTLVVTNSAGTGSMVIGQLGRATYNLNGGTVTVNQLYVTNIVSGAT